MKLISWNVNGIRACVNKGFKEFFKETNADIFCIQFPLLSLWECKIYSSSLYQVQ